MAFFFPRCLRPVLCVLLLAWSCSTVSLVSAQGTPAAQAAKRVALVIGNAAYTGTNPLRNPINDATDMAAALQQSGFVVARHTNLGRNQMNRVIEDFMKRAQGADLVLVYYSGHGLQTGGETFLVPTDAKIQTERDIRAEGVRLGEFMEDLEAKQIKHTVMILDACRDNPFVARTRSTKRGLAPPREMNGAFLVAYATSDGATADDGEGRNGTYTGQLLRQIQSGRDKSIRDIMEDTQLAVERVTQGAQRPKVYGDTVKFRDVFLPASKVAARANTLDLGEVEAWEAARRQATSASYREFLSQYPAGEYAAAARTALLAFTGSEAVVSAPARPQGAAQALEAPAVAVQPGRRFQECDVCPELVEIAGGSFLMGDDSGDSDEKPARRVSVPAFALGRLEVTQAQWRAVMGSNPSKFAECGDDCPVNHVSWQEVQEYLSRLSKRTGKTYRLPSEAEWEYAARAGTTTRRSFGDDDSAVRRHAWYAENSDGKLQATGRFPPNAFGLHDMLGGVWEWTQDCWHDTYVAAPTDGSAWLSYCSKDQRVQRGGSWSDSPGLISASTRDAAASDLRFETTGFRVARSLGR